MRIVVSWHLLQSSRLLDEYDFLSTTGCRLLLITSKHDVRYGAAGQVHTHTGRCSLQQGISALLLERDVPDCALDDVDAILIDEAQFFPDLIAFVTRAIARPRAPYVVVAGLDLDASRSQFGQVVELARKLASSVTNLTATCAVCAKPAAYTEKFRTSHVSMGDDQSSGVTTSGESAADPGIEVGGAESYRPVCSTHWRKPFGSALPFR